MRLKIAEHDILQICFFQFSFTNSMHPSQMWSLNLFIDQRLPLSEASKLQIAFFFLSANERFLILFSQVTYRRIKSGLTELEKQISGPASQLVSVLFGEASPKSQAPFLPQQLTQANGSLAFYNRKLCIFYSRRNDGENFEG